MARGSAEILVERGTVVTDDGVTWAADPKLRVASRYRLTEPQVLEFLGRIAAPTLIVRATDGWPADPEVMRQRGEAIRGALRVEVAGHHHVHLDEPELVAAHMRDFLAPQAGDK